MAVHVHRTGNRPDGPLEQVITKALPMGTSVRVTAADHLNVGLEVMAADGSYAEALLRASELPDLLVALAELARGYGHDVHVGQLPPVQAAPVPPPAPPGAEGPQAPPAAP